MHLEQKVQFLLVLGLALVFEGGKCLDQEVIVAYGSVAVLPCVDESSALPHPSAVYWSRIVDNLKKTVWRREKSGLEFRPVKSPSRVYCPAPNFGKGDYSLHITGIMDKDGGRYICDVEGKTSMTKAIMLRIVKVSFSPPIVMEGFRVDPKCIISPKPQIGRLHWELNGKATDKAVLYSVSQRDSGNWTCRVSYNNVVGKATAFLQVRGISTPPADSSMVYAAVGSSVSLPCVFTEGLVQHSGIWDRSSKTRNSSPPLPSSLDQRSLVPLSSRDRSAWIETVEDGDEGIYTCSGMMKLENIQMKAQRSMQLVVARVLSSSSKGQMTLTCHLSNFSQVTSYEWLRVIYGVNNTQTVTSVSTSKSLKIPKVSEQDIGEWVCRYNGKDGLLGNVTYQLHMMGAQMGQSDSKSGNKVGMVMGLGFLFLVVFLILFQMYKNYRRKKRIFLYPAMETIVHEAATEQERIERCQAKLNEACGGELKSMCV
ncbi:lymphocyte activation gene 3 protein-like [Triplophysa rosa]|uniref:Lymphocyte activation gene 3 protein-like protein n=1 Tax=Triplophysa rosa TaxID=992332 RepID=A0A9W7WRK7_TRIRA|nr:lymphocyte activation gene 3 protein-like [Triplophysa rosa]KAI7807036.1 putative lymphocyte activation gene 3 protein-like protein [Triplophysa rosa]